jgi:hypothetical protein
MTEHRTENPRVARLRELAEAWSGTEHSKFYTDCADEIERLRALLRLNYLLAAYMVDEYLSVEEVKEAVAIDTEKLFADTRAAISAEPPRGKG